MSRNPKRPAIERYRDMKGGGNGSPSKIPPAVAERLEKMRGKSAGIATSKPNTRAVPDRSPSMTSRPSTAELVAKARKYAGRGNA